MKHLNLLRGGFILNKGVHTSLKRPERDGLNSTSEIKEALATVEAQKSDLPPIVGNGARKEVKRIKPLKYKF